MTTIIILVFFITLLFTYSVLRIIFANKILMETRLGDLKIYDQKKCHYIDEELQKSFIDRIIKPILHSLSIITQKITPIRKRDIIGKKLILAGNPWSLNVGEFMSLYYTIMGLTGMLVSIVSFYYRAAIWIQAIGLVWGALLGRVLLDTYLKLLIKRRQTSIAKELPDVLDLLTVSVEAGLGFDAALKKVIDKTKGPISLEFHKTLQEIKMGKPRREALRDLVNRTDEEDLNTFISAIIQADQMGVGIGNVLRIQSKQMRQQRKQRIEEKAMKAPIKMLLPMVFFIFPTIFIVLLGPVVIQIIEDMR